MAEPARPLAFTVCEQDALAEMVNIAMGQAGASLAQIVDTFITLSVPNVRIIDPQEFRRIALVMLDQHDEIIAIRQAFYNRPCGEAVVIFESDSCRAFAGLMGYDPDEQGFVEQELLLDVSNVMIGSFLNGITQQLGTELSFSPPTILAEGADIKQFSDLLQGNRDHVLSVEIQFTLEDQGHTCRMMIFTPEDSIRMIRSKIEEMLGFL